MEKEGERVNGKSIMGVMMLAAEQGAEIIVETEGEDAAEAVEAVVQPGQPVQPGPTGQPEQLLYPVRIVICL